jgi:hypothetical protein
MESNRPAMKTLDDRARLALIDDLERLRALVSERLSSIEILIRENSAGALSAREVAAREESIGKKSAELEEARRMLQVQAERERQDWITAMSQLENDRQLLAEAWERVEEERIDSQCPRHASLAHQSHLSTHLTAVPTGLPTKGATIPVRTGSVESDSYNPVAQDILRQFQTLRSDVRQSAMGRRATH